MKAILKFVGILFGLVIVAVAALVLYVSSLDPNDYKSTIANRFQEETGRTLAITGNIGVTVYPWLGIELNGVTVGNAPGFGDQPFLHTDHALVRIKLLPLLQDKYEIDTVRLHGLTLNLMKNPEGVTNWADLASGEGSERGGHSDVSLAALVLGGVDVRDASMTWEDQTNGTRYAISSLMLTTGELVFGEPIDINLDLDAVSNRPELAADVSMTSTVSYDLDNQVYDIAPLDFTMMLAGPNVPQNAADITLQSAIRINLDDETLRINDLAFNALGTQLTGTIAASEILDDEPSIDANINLQGEDLALLFRVAEIEPLATQLASLADRSFSLSTAVSADLDDDEVDISGLQASLLGADLAADLQGRNIQSDAPAVEGTVNASGPDLPSVLQVLGQLQGGQDSSLSQLAVQLRNAGNLAFDFAAGIDADLGDGELTIRNMRANLVGASIDGEVEASRLDTDTPSLSGNLNASGPNLPSLMQLVGQLQGGADSPLTVYGRQLDAVGNKSFVINTRFDADLEDGDINLPRLSLDALGIQLEGNLVASNMQGNDGSVNGQFNLTGSSMGQVLAALDQADLGEVLQSMELTAAVNGTRSDMGISPLGLKLVFAGDQIPNSPVELALAADSRLNLERETLVLNNLRMTGMGLDVSGNVNAQNIFDAREFSGDIQVAPFSLRRFMRQLNQEIPDATDNTTFETVALDSDFSGSANHLNISRLAATLDESKLVGTLTMTDFESPAVEFGIDIDTINADRYLPPATEDGQPRPVTPETVAGAAAQLPLETLRSLNARGELRIGQLVISNARVSDVVLGLNARDGRIGLSPVAANLYEGAYQGDISLDATSDQPVMTFDSSLVGVAIDPLLQDVLGAANVSGMGNVNLNVTARGIDTPTMIQNLNGTGSIALEDGVLRGVDIARVLAQVEIMIRNRRPAQIDRGQQTPFETFTSTLNITNGIVSSNDLQITSPGIRVTGQGTVINLNDNRINYDLLASADRGTATRGEEQYDIGGYSIPIKCSGVASDPRCLPNVERIVSEVVQQEVQRQIGSALQRALGVEQSTTPAQEESTTGTQTQQQTQQQMQQQEQEQTQQEQTEPADPTREILNRALEGIFNR